MLNKVPGLKKTIRARAKGHINIRPTSEAMLELVTLLFLNSLAEEAKTRAFEDKSATIRSNHIRDVSKKLLKKARG
ncbi:centromere protein W [Gouania willdenowi]|uniref:centromere protein W n=1 Tax=Gouania willdenowi TaxID=441366 RepID=UPI001056AFBD|nr:centromere protein W [Gouania willdenowi]XP_028296030.1 centromere protein W [Gouania willdenowi]